MQKIKNPINHQLPIKPYFWNVAGNHEIDLLLEQNGRLLQIETKSGRTINSQFFDGLKYFQNLSGAQPDDSFLVYGGDELQTRSMAQVVSWRNLEKVPL